MGHIRALKEDLTAIGFDAAQKQQTWNPSYEVIATKRDAIASLRRAAQGAEVYLGSDDDREGEAIAWHTCQILGLDPTTTPRVTFHEITESALKAATQNPGRIDINKFHAQQARTMLDMLIGFTLSPCLWRSVGYKPGLSAGRCQTPALRIIYDRDRVIEAHTVAMSWKLQVESAHELTWKSDVSLATEAEAVAALAAFAAQKPQVLVVKERLERVATSAAPSPFITSSLQQEASSRLGMNPKTTMRLAQSLYEMGHITYMRTDSAILSEEAATAGSAIITGRWGSEYLASSTKDKKPVKKVIKNATNATNATSVLTAQNAHEAIRPTHFETEEPAVGPQELRLYKLIWTRAIQSLMASETRDVVTLTSQSLKTTWDQTKFAGWRVIDAERKAEEEAAAATIFAARASIKVGDAIPWTIATATEVRTSPPPRYTEASLIRDLESKSIGRPSTYATLVETVLERGYVEKATIPAQTVPVRSLELKAGAKSAKATTRNEKTGSEKEKLRTTALGRTVIEWLLTTFGDMLEYDFTAAMETRLDEVAKGTRLWSTVLQDTWATYADRYKTIMTTKTDNPNKKDFGDGYKLVVSKKGPLFVLEADGQKAKFAPVPANLSVQAATRQDAEAAFKIQDDSELLGELGGAPVLRKKGPYGHYVTWKEKRVSCKIDDTLETLTPKLQVINDVDHTVGPYKIRKGAYGLYMFRTGTKGKPTFVSIPDATPWSTLTPETAEQIYKHCAKTKVRAKQSPNTETAS